MKRTIIIPLLFCLSLIAMAQTNKDQEKNNYLIPVDKEQERKFIQDDLSLSFYAEEISRLLIPSNAAFGVVFRPSLFSESSITCDTQRRLLMYTTVDDGKTIWGCVCDATEVIEDGVERMRDKPENYQAPMMKTYSLTISNDALKHLLDLWSAAIDAAKPLQGDQNVLDGIGREFFINGKYARTHGGSIKEGRILRLLNLVGDLRQAIIDGDSERAEKVCQESVSLTKEFESLK